MNAPSADSLSDGQPAPVNTTASSPPFAEGDSLQTGTNGRYELGEEIARGGMGVILRGWDRNLNRPLAFKIVHEALKSDPNILRRFHDEGQILGQLQHPGIIPV